MAEKKANKANQDKQLSFIREILSGNIITEKIILKNLGYISFVTILTVFYIGNRFHAEKITRETARIMSEVKDLRAESIATSAALMDASRQSEVIKQIK